MSVHPFRRRKPLTASSTPAATQRSIISPPRHRFTFRFTWRVRLSRLSAALVVARDRCRRAESCSVRAVSGSGNGAAFPSGPVPYPTEISPRTRRARRRSIARFRAVRVNHAAGDPRRES